MHSRAQSTSSHTPTEVVDVDVLVLVLDEVDVELVLVVVVDVVVGGGGAIYPTQPHHAGTIRGLPPPGVYFKPIYELFATESSNTPEFPVLLTPKITTTTLLLAPATLRLNVYELGVPGDICSST